MHDMHKDEKNNAPIVIENDESVQIAQIISYIISLWNKASKIQ